MRRVNGITELAQTRDEVPDVLSERFEQGFVLEEYLERRQRRGDVRRRQ